MNLLSNKPTVNNDNSMWSMWYFKFMDREDVPLYQKLLLKRMFFKDIFGTSYAFSPLDILPVAIKSYYIEKIISNPPRIFNVSSFFLWQIKRNYTIIDETIQINWR